MPPEGHRSLGLRGLPRKVGKFGFLDAIEPASECCLRGLSPASYSFFHSPRAQLYENRRGAGSTSKVRPLLVVCLDFNATRGVHF